jgi:multiple antibiotic resistance protein
MALNSLMDLQRFIQFQCVVVMSWLELGNGLLRQILCFITNSIENIMDFAFLLKTGIALFAIVNPIGSVPIFISATNGWSEKDKQRICYLVAITVFSVLSVAALLGEHILNFFGISIPSFQVAGGILIMLIALHMLNGKQRRSGKSSDNHGNLADKEMVAVVPLSVPLLAGPGAISSVIIAAEHQHHLFFHLSLLIPISIVVAIAWLALRLSGYIAQLLGVIGINIVTRLMGLILAAMAVEFIAKGINGLFAHLA